MQKQAKTIVPIGLSRNTPDRDSKDGSLLEIINMRYKDGAWRGVGDKEYTGKKSISSDVFSHICYHPALPADTYILLNETDNKVYTILFSAAGNETPALVLDLGSEVFDRFSHLGNVLLIFTNLNKHVLYWDKVSLSYKDLTFLPVPVLNVGDSDFRNYTVTLEYPEPAEIPDYGLGAANTYEYHRLMIEAEYMKYLADEKKANRIDGFVMVRLAYKLYDGTYIKHTCPLIHNIGYSTDGSPVINRDALTTTTTLTNITTAKLGIWFSFFNTGMLTIPDFNTLKVIESLDIFCTRPVNAFDIAATYDKWGQLDGKPPYNFEAVKGVLEDGQFYKVHSIAISDLTTLAEVVIPDFTKEISSNELLPVDNFSHHTLKSESDYEYNSRLHLSNVDTLLSGSLNNVYHSLFYRQYFEYGSLLDDTNFRMIPDAFRYNSVALTSLFLGGDTGYIKPIGYNDKIIYQQVWLRSDAGRKVVTTALQQSFIDTFDAGYPDTYKQYLHAKVTWSALSGTITIAGGVITGVSTSFTTELLVNDTIKIGTHIAYVKSIISNTEMAIDRVLPDDTGLSLSLGIASSDLALILNPIISYPDFRAYKMRYYYVESDVEYFLKDFDLKPNPAQNTAYFCQDLVYPHLGGVLGSTEMGDGSNGMYYPNIVPIIGLSMPSDSPTDDSTIHDTNRMQVSGIFNPFIWPAINSYRFGLTQNELIAVQGVQQQMSDSAFGQYPLYIFSTHGVFTISHGSGEVLYGSIQPLNNDRLLSMDSINSISGAIVFATKEGIRVISGSQSNLISVPVVGSIFNPLAQQAHFISALSELNLPIINNFRSNVPFLTYIQGCKILHDVYNEEIIITNPAYSYSYTFNLESKTWATRTESFTSELVVGGMAIGVKKATDDTDITLSLHYLNSEDTSASSTCKYLMMQTRPLNLTTINSKRIDRLVLRSAYTNPADEFGVFLVYGSNDLNTWNIITYQQTITGGDVYATRLLGNYKYFIVVFACARLNATVHQLDVMYSEKFAQLMK